jgi:hypothetical protein
MKAVCVARAICGRVTDVNLTEKKGEQKCPHLVDLDIDAASELDGLTEEGHDERRLALEEGGRLT